MEGHSHETYSRSVLDIAPGRDKTAVIFKNLFTSPLPYSGVSACPLNAHPKGQDGFRVINSSPTCYTTWNVQTRSNLVAFGARVHSAIAVETEPEAQRITPPTILRGVALADAIRARTDLTTTVIHELNNERRWMTNQGTILKRLPNKKQYRESKLNKRDIENARSRSAPPGAHDGESRPSTANSEYEMFSAEAAPKTGIPKKIPLRSVEPTLASIQGSEPIGVPKSQAYLYMEQYAGEKGPASQGLPPGTRSTFARDTPSVAYLISHMAGSNATFIDTAPMLRAMLYAHPSTVDAWESDKLDRHFIRQQVQGSRSNLTMRILDQPAADRLQLQAIVVTLPAFTAHVKGVDTLLGNPDPAVGHNFLMAEIDISWTVVPIDSTTLHQPWLMEHIMAYLSSEYWAGRTNWIWNARYHGAGAQQHRAYLTSIPNSHNVYIPGPTRVMLVLVEDNGYAATPSITIPGRAAPLAVYPGAKNLRADVVNLDGYVNNLSGHWYDNVFTTANYATSASRMVHALHYMEENASTNMAFAAAVTLASEIANSMPEGPHILPGNEARTYTNVIYGAWTFGARNLANRAPQMQTNDVNTGTEAERENNFAKMVAAYTFAALSPCLQYPASSTSIVAADARAGDVYLGKAVRWEHPTPTKVVSQYICHVAHSVYRILRCLGYIIKNEYKFNIASPAALQSVLTMNGVMQTMALTTALVMNDVSLKVWTGLGADDQVAVHMSTSALVADWTNNFIKQRHPSKNFEQLVVVHNDTVDTAIDHYYGLETTEDEWATHVPLPLHALLQWVMKAGVQIHRDFPVTFGKVTGGLVARYATFKFGNHSVLPMAAGTADVHKTAPVSYQQSLTSGSRPLPLYLDEWSEMTSGVFDADVAAGKYQSNVMAVSMRYHYQDTANDTQVVVINDMLCSKLDLAATYSLDPMGYPDPPNMEIFQVGQVAARGDPKPQNKEQEQPVKNTLRTETIKVASVPTTVQTSTPILTAATGPAQSSQSGITIPILPEATTELPVIQSKASPSTQMADPSRTE